MNSSPNKLTTEEKKFIEDNFLEIKSRIRKLIKNNNIFYNEYKEELVDQAVNLSPIAIKEFDSEKCKNSNMTLVSFVAQRCILRLMDEYRRNSTNTILNQQRKKQIGRIIDKVTKEKGYCEHADIVHELSGYKLNKITKLIQANNWKILSVPANHVIATSVSSNKRPEDDVIWNDLEQYIVKKSEEFFPENPFGGYGPKSQNVFSRVRKLLIQQYFLPRATGKEGKTFKEIAGCLKLTVNRVIQISHDQAIVDFFKECGIDNHAS